MKISENGEKRQWTQVRKEKRRPSEYIHPHMDIHFGCRKGKQEVSWTQKTGLMSASRQLDDKAWLE